MTIKTGVYFIFTGFILMWAIFTTGWLTTEQRMNRTLQQEISRKQITIDSLNGECFTKEIEVGRYEVILDRISEKDSALVEEAMHGVE